MKTVTVETMLCSALVMASLFGLALGAPTASAQEATGNETQTSAPVARVGVYDSRAIAIAYAASDMFHEEMQTLREEYETGKTAGNDTRVKEIDAAMQARQAVFHRQGFGAAPVDDILAHIKDELPGIAEAAGVEIVISKWAINYQTPSASTKDITLQMVAPFNPSERTLQIIADLKDKAPVPLKDLEQMHDHQSRD